MGLGGDLIWTAVLKAVHDNDGLAPVACNLPRISDLMAGRLYEGANSLRDNTVFHNNPYVTFTENRRKGLGARALDAVGAAIFKLPPIRRSYEEWVFRRAELIWAEGGPHYIHVDMRRHSYAARQTRRRTYWKEGRAADAIAEPFGIAHVDMLPNLHFTKEEELNVARLLAECGIEGPYVVVEPDTNRDWFGELRAWPMDRWQAVTDRLRTDLPNLPIVQIGLGRSGILSGVVDLTGKTSFRGAALVVGGSALFMGTEGGLMHAARAMDASSLILWGGVTIPEFIGYPDHQLTICRYAACSPCGNAGWCDHGHQCMMDIEVDEVVDAALRLLAARTAAKGQGARRDRDRPLPRLS